MRIDFTCPKCNSSCATCSQSAANCTKCANGYFPENTTFPTLCRNFCPTGTYKC